MTRLGAEARRVGRGLFKLTLFAAVLLVAMLAVASLRAPDLPDDAPAFELVDLNGEAVRLSDFEGQTVLLNFWATWCLPCKLEVPALARFARANPDVVVLGLAADRDVETVRATAESLSIPYTVLLADPATLRAYGIDTFPTTVIVGPDGRVKRAYTGLMLDPHLLWATR